MLSFVIVTITPQYRAECSKLSMQVVLGSTLAFTSLVALVMRHTFDGTGWVNSFMFVFRVWVWFH